MTSDAIEIRDYDPGWPRQFAEIAARVGQALGDQLIVSIEHVGSTAVPGLAAKPVVDVDVVIASVANLPRAIAGLATLGYVYEGNKGISGRHAFRWPPDLPRHHLYVCASGNEELGRHLLFRDYLRLHPEDAQRYAVLKRELAARYRDDRVAYNDGKTAFVRGILALAEAAEGENTL